jgi:hypothetical protein
MTEPLTVVYSAMWEGIDPTLKEWREEARELRESVGELNGGDSLQTLHEHLIAARRAQTRLEALMADCALLRSRIRKLLLDLDAVYEDKFAENVLNDRTGEYQSAKAQDARYKAGALSELRNVRQVKNWLTDVEEVYEFIRTKYWGLDAVRDDLKSLVRIISLESQLER